MSLQCPTDGCVHHLSTSLDYGLLVGRDWSPLRDIYCAMVMWWLVMGPYHEMTKGPALLCLGLSELQVFKHNKCLNGQTLFQLLCDFLNKLGFHKTKGLGSRMKAFFFLISCFPGALELLPNPGLKFGATYNTWCSSWGHRSVRLGLHIKKTKSMQTFWVPHPLQGPHFVTIVQTFTYVIWNVPKSNFSKVVRVIDVKRQQSIGILEGQIFLYLPDLPGNPLAWASHSFAAPCPLLLAWGCWHCLLYLQGLQTCSVRPP